jgi:hypothetical protein
MREVVSYSHDISEALLGRRIAVNILSDVTLPYVACFGSQGLTFNLGRLGNHWFEEAFELGGTPSEALNDLILHELGHYFEGNHLDDRYHAALTLLGAKLTRLALDRPILFHRNGGLL